ncbi:putative ATP-dependent RNA helicase DDX27 [Saccoglossus kowalevskii]|uniref:RNA helicase n=1 Tax=Saccoglossus kowalevskii TaxID=10224 RepID=A0ABM0GXL9_SACKO|nr:PREDICTED: probable ATP-dependent RNA helicase DDX27-like [Saccoglossus kowalevskii]
MALSALGFVGTIGDDDEIHIVSEESDSDDEAVKPKKKRQKKNTEFASGFEFTEKTVDDGALWNIDMYLRKKKLSSFSTLDEKIARLRKEKKKEKLTEKTYSKKDNNKVQLEENKEEMEKNEESEEKEDGEENEDEDSDTESDLESLSDDELIADTLLLKKQHEKTLEREKKKRKGKDKVKSMNSDSNQLTFQDAPPLDENTSFQDMNLSRPLLKAINAMNFVHPTPIQVATIPVALLGKDICACAATGTGKTAAFMLPVLERLLYKPKQAAVTRVLVLVPTRELGIQVHSVTRQLAQFTEIDSCLAVGGLDVKLQEAVLRQGPDIVIATPGRLIDHLHNAPSFSLSNIEILILDEADRMLDEYFEEQMKEIIRMCSITRQTMLFSATMTDEVKDLVAVSLKNPVRLFINENTDVAYNLRQEFIRIRENREGDREAIAAALCSRTFHDHVIVFVQTKKQCHRLHIILGMLGLNVGELHGNLSQTQRLETLRRFKESNIDIMLATDLAARGLDIEGIKTIINFTMPNTVKHYVHRVGRTARAGKSGRSVSLCGEKERKMLKEIVKRARNPVKSRVVPPDIVAKYRDKIEKMETDIEKIIKLEEEEKELRISELQVNKAKAIIEHHDEIYSRPKRSWFQSHMERMAEKEKLTLGKTNVKPSNKSKKQHKKPETPEERVQFEVMKAQEYAIREAKRAGKAKRMTVFDDNMPDTTAKVSKKKVKSVHTSFEKELTNTSRRAVKGFRHRPSSYEERKKKSKGGKFKSKKKFKRR